MNPYLNANGLVNGNIPAGKPCPFYNECRLKGERCPHTNNLKDCAFSCATARLHSTILEGKKKGYSLPIMEAIRDGEIKVPVSMIPKAVED